jgi:hypothetical protein
MSTVTFDTFAFNTTLREGGFDEKQAAALTKAQSKAAEQIHDAGEYATKSDIMEVRKDMQVMEERMTANFYKAMMMQTLAIAGIVIAVVKFVH